MSSKFLAFLFELFLMETAGKHEINIVLNSEENKEEQIQLLAKYLGTGKGMSQLEHPYLITAGDSTFAVRDPTEISSPILRKKKRTKTKNDNDTDDEAVGGQNEPEQQRRKNKRNIGQTFKT
eukprot:gene20659-22700_t